jgi:hypothetical protein
LGHKAQFFFPPVQQDPETQTVWDRYDIHELQQAFNRLLAEQKEEERAARGPRPQGGGRGYNLSDLSDI